MEIINQSNFQNNKINQNLRDEFFVEIPNFIKNVKIDIYRYYRT